MKIPKKLKIGGHIILIKYKKSENSGYWEPKESTIFINPDYPQSHQEATLIHEIFHAINAIIGDKEIFHALLDSLSEQIYQVLKDNKLLN